MSTPESLLKNCFGLTSFRPGQKQIIESLLSGQSALAVFPTGGGKSLCYQLPALMFEGLTLVVSPLIALMKDQVDQLQALNIPAARLDSSIDADELQRIYQGLSEGRIKLLYTAPERLTNERFINRLKSLNISMMAIDEAHCVSEWGHNFRPDYLKLAKQAKSLRVGRVLALTATATPEVAEQIRDSFDIPVANHIQTGFFRPNLAISVRPTPHNQRQEVLLSSLLAHSQQATIVYVTLQKTAEQVADFLSLNGLSVRAYHAGLKDQQRSEVQEAFMANEIAVVVATIAFGMGIDKSDIRAIYHFNLPKSLENYMQEIGRAGRDGEPSQCQLLIDTEDLTVLENFTFGDTPEDSAVQELIERLLKNSEEFDISVYELAQEFDIRPLVINTLLTYLELHESIASIGPFYSEYKIAFKTDQATTLQYFDEARQGFLQAVFATGKQGRTWLTIHPTEAAISLNQDRQRILNALNYLEGQNFIDLKLSGIRHRYRLLHKPASITGLIEQIQEKFKNREQRDMERMQQVCRWAASKSCLQQALVAYFGEQLAEPCGQCSSCKGEPAVPVRRLRHAPDLSVVRSLQSQPHEALSTARQQARLLCGITSPKLGRARLGKHPAFGALANCRFEDVLKACAEELFKKVEY